MIRVEDYSADWSLPTLYTEITQSLQAILDLLWIRSWSFQAPFWFSSGQCGSFQRLHVFNHPSTLGFITCLKCMRTGSLVKFQSVSSIELFHSAERIRDFLLIDHEPAPTEDGKPPAYWPASGILKAENLSARYSQGTLRLCHMIESRYWWTLSRWPLGASKLVI